MSLSASRRRMLARLRVLTTLALVLPLFGLAAVAGYLYRQAFDSAREQLATRRRATA